MAMAEDHLRVGALYYLISGILMGSAAMFNTDGTGLKWENATVVTQAPGENGLLAYVRLKYIVFPI